ncbi:MAG: DUF547 domain-containing protein [Bacteroidota bacterium]
MKKIIQITLFLLALVSLQSCALFSAAGISSQGQPVKKVKTPLVSTASGSAVNLDHSQWDQLLKKHVDQDGLVDYKGFKQDRESLNTYLQYLSSQEPSKAWSVQELLAYYINLYNAYTVDLILDNYPVKSIKDINGPWTRGIVPIGKNNLSLGGIENGILRKMEEPRIHFAINCASISCPNLLGEAYTAARINEQLDRAAQEFINGPKNEISANNPKLSSIFDWYRKDYTVNGEQDVVAYINQYSNTKISQGSPLNYKEYNWNLNEQN